MKRTYFFSLWLLFVCVNSFAQIGNSVFNESVLHNIYVTTSMNQATFIDTLYARKTSGVYTDVNITFDGTLINNVGIKFKGNYTYSYANTSDKKPIKFDFSEFVNGQKYDGLSKLNLVNGFGDPSFLRDAISYKLLREIGVPAPRTSFAKLYVNNNYFGLYLLVEEEDKKFLERNGYPDKNGNLYEAEFSDLIYESNLKSDYIDNFEQQEEYQGDTTWTDLIGFHQMINNPNNFYTNLQSNFQIDHFLKSMAVDFSVANWDNFLGHGRNFSLYHSTTNNKFYWIPWDYGFAFGEQAPFDNLLWTGFVNNGGNIFWNNCMDVPALQNQYLQYVCQVNNMLANSSLDSYIENMRTLILPALNTDPNKHYPVVKFNEAIDNQNVTVMEIFSLVLGPEARVYPGLKYKIGQRHSIISGLMASQNISCSILGTGDVSTTKIKIYPNPITDKLFLELESNAISNIEIYSLDGRLINSYSYNDTTISLPVSNLTSGVYFVHIKTDKLNEIIKFIKNDN